MSELRDALNNALDKNDELWDIIDEIDIKLGEVKDKLSDLKTKADAQLDALRRLEEPIDEVDAERFAFEHDDDLIEDDDEPEA